ncbi:MAG: hypothetical protein Q8N38_04275 [Bacteroidales bacterium]|nr:hypothetical protein [Bacteroidales bacterium]
MKKLIILLTVVLLFTYCKGPGSGPLVKESFSKEDQNQKMEGQNHKAQVKTEKIDIVVEPCGECITIAKLLADKKSYSGKVIKIKGKVTKFNPAIMGKNWVHIQDGSEFQGGFDLTITTDIQAAVGETITFEGKIVLDKDFGYGYFYNVLMEDGKSVL